MQLKIQKKSLRANLFYNNLIHCPKIKNNNILIYLMKMAATKQISITLM